MNSKFCLLVIIKKFDFLHFTMAENNDEVFINKI